VRKILLGMLFTFAVLAAGWANSGTASAADLGRFNAPLAGSQIQTVQYGGGYSHCQRLRYHCEHKYELGESGEGNCRRYKEECGDQSYCRQLRYRCEHKYELGESGEGNCRRYHQQCGGY